MNLPSTIGAIFSMSRLALGEELLRVLRAVDAGRLDLDLLESGAAQFRPVLGFLQRSGDASDPQLHAAADGGRDLAAHHHVRDREASAGPQHAKRLGQHTILVA